MKESDSDLADTEEKEKAQIENYLREFQKARRKFLAKTSSVIGQPFTKNSDDDEED